MQLIPFKLSRRCWVLTLSACLLLSTALLEAAHHHDAGQQFADCLQCQLNGEQAPAAVGWLHQPDVPRVLLVAHGVPAEQPARRVVPLIRGPPFFLS